MRASRWGWLGAVLLLVQACAPVEPPAPLIVNRKSFEFGTVELGVEAKLTVAVTNPNDHAVTFQVLELSGTPAELTLTGSSAPLEPNERRFFTLAWKPTTEQTIDGTFELEASDGAGRRSLPVRAQSGTLDAALELNGAATCGPAHSLALGEVTYGTPATRVITLTSTGTAPIRVLRAVLPTPEVGLAVTGPFGQPIAPGTSADFTLSWNPIATGPRVADVKLLTDSVLHPEVLVSMCGTGHAPLLCVQPKALSFGTVGVGVRDMRALTLTSCGDLPVTVSSLVSTPAPAFTITPRTPAPAVLAPGDALVIDVSFAPLDPGAARTSLVITSNSALDAVLEVPLSGNQPPPCNLKLSTTQVDLFAFAPRGVVTMTNQGANDCVLERLDLVPAQSAFAFDRVITPPVRLGARSSLSFDVVYLPGGSGIDRATVELEFDRVWKVALTGTSLPPRGCRLIPTPASVDFGLLAPSATGRTIVELTNVGAGGCHLFSVTSDLPALAINYPASTVDPQSTLRLDFTWDPAKAMGMTNGTLTIQSDDLVNPEWRLPVAGGHTLCDPNCMCTSNEQLATWRYTPGWPGSAVTPADMGQTAYQHSCEPKRCENNDVLFEVEKGSLSCVAPPLDCNNGLQPDWVNEQWQCTSCDVIVQFGSLYDGLRVCAPRPQLSCSGGSSPTFDATDHQWQCVPTCNNGLYDQRMVNGTLVCVPC